MNILLTSNTDHLRVNGRDIFTGTGKKSEDTTVTQYPLLWFKPEVRGGSIAFGPGISYETGEVPTGSESTFAAGQRICLVETLLPIVERYAVEYGSPLEYTNEYLNVTDVTRSAEIMVIPSPYVSTPSVIRNPDASSPEISIIVLGYLNASRGLAIAEKVEYSGSIDDILYPPYSVIKRYPYFIVPLIEGLGYTTTSQAAEYYYTEEELAAAGGPEA